ncbi:uncharacterized protein LOC131180143 [Hevea brasiliensis]|uniref:uncharacterized protein LOC131180143 n=1 Tax=Hevea brasiliensis TaxID=3981 RepID=UPI0025CD533A|nr:uncharacterized protein LOC131180143 [Hevea brasiliensis]
MEFIESFPYVIQYKHGKENLVADALSHRYSLHNTLDSKFLRFEFVKELYADYKDFATIYATCEKWWVMGHFGVAKTLDILKEHFFWPHMRRDSERACSRWETCKRAKSRAMPNGLYTPFPIPKEPWVDISMDFILGLLRSKRGHDSIYVERFPNQQKSKLQPSDGPLQVLQRINNNTYKIDLPDRFKFEDEFLSIKRG